jgi:hypothetical protein
MSRAPNVSRGCKLCGDLGKLRVLVPIQRNGLEKLVVKWVLCDCRPVRVRVRLGKVIRPVKLMAPVDYPDVERPRTREDCRGGLRPCPFVSCRFNNYLNVTKHGYIALTWEGLEPDEVAPELSCAEDLADRARRGDPPTLEEVGRALGISRERARQLEEIALARLEEELRAQGIERKDVRDE